MRYDDFENDVRVRQDDAPLTVECDVTLTIKRRVKMKVSANILTDEDDYGNVVDELDHDSIDWDSEIESVVPKNWNLEAFEVEDVEWLKRRR